MPFTPKFVDLVRNVTSVTGTGPVTLGAAVSGYTSLATAVSSGDQFYYCIQGVDKPQEREVGRGTMQSDGRVVRQPIVGSPTNFSSGTKTIALVAAAEWYESLGQLGSGGAALAASTRSELAAKNGVGTGPVLLVEVGREGLFRFDSGNLSASVAADPRQAMVIAPASASSGSSGAWVRKFSGPVNVRWFGAVGDDVTDDGPAFMAAIAYLRSIAAGGVYSSASPTLFIPFGQYFLGTTTLDISHTITIEGEGTGDAGGNGTILRWAANTTGIRLQAYNTSGASTVDGTGHTSAAASIIERLMLKGAFAGSEGEFHGIHLKVRAIIRDCYITNFQGDGIHAWCSAGAGDATEGNCNNLYVEKCWIDSCRNGLFLKGGDTNAGMTLGLNVNSNRQWGIWDESFLGNSHFAAHADGNGISYAGPPYTMVEKSGHWYSVRTGQAAGASVNAPSGTAADNVWWFYVGDHAAAPSVPTWASGISVREGGSYKSATAWFWGCYEEGGQGPCIVDGLGSVNEGLVTNRGSGGYQHTGVGGYTNFNKLKVRYDTNLVGQIQYGDGTADLLHQFSYVNGANLVGMSSGGTYNAQLAFNPFYLGLFHLGEVRFYIGTQMGAAQVAGVDTNGLNLQAGKAYRVNSVQVVGARQTGWATDTGTSKKTANATYSGTAEGAYTQATIQALMNTVRDISQTQKAIKDALIAHGLIGT